ncbi:hypothetical protein [Rheinheimera sp.]|uniref:hypothetical protein n=1 Tax=Rheinheimera sp. TaxID=1869214 RepID=UPI00404789EA
MAAKSLTKEEKAWLKKLQAVFDECPSVRLSSYTTGDPFLSIYDKTMDSEINAYHDKSGGEFCNAVDDVGAGLAIIRTPFPIHSTAG